MSEEVEVDDDDVSSTDKVLADLERRRWHLWVVACVLLVAISIGVVVALGAESVTGRLLEDSPALRYGFLAVSLAFILYVADQERTFRMVTRQMMAQREQTASLEGRLRDLTSLVSAARAVNSVLSPERVFDELLSRAIELTGAGSGAVFLKVGEELTTAATRGPAAPEPGARLPIRSGPIGRALTTGAAQMVGAQTNGDGVRRASGVAAPLVVKDRNVGVIAVERESDADPFTEADVSTVMLFAEHAATAVANASRFEQERSRVESLITAAERRSEFVARMVHDLRSPLVAVIGYAQLLNQRADRMSSVQQVRALESIVEQGERLRRMVEEILASSSAEAGAEPRRDPVDVSAMLYEIADLIPPMAGARGEEHRPVHVIGAAEPVTVWGDKEALRHILVNLAENAVKYSDPGSPMTLEIVDHDTEVVISIRDRGRGISEEDIVNIFERFRQTDGGDRGGVGLGLYIVRTLVQAHSGRIWVDSVLGEGTTFHVALPIRADARAEQNPETGTVGDLDLARDELDDIDHSALARSLAFNAPVDEVASAGLGELALPAEARPHAWSAQEETA